MNTNNFQSVKFWFIAADLTETNCSQMFIRWWALAKHNALCTFVYTYCMSLASIIHFEMQENTTIVCSGGLLLHRRSKGVLFPCQVGFPEWRRHISQLRVSCFQQESSEWVVGHFPVYSRFLCSLGAFEEVLGDGDVEHLRCGSLFTSFITMNDNNNGQQPPFFYSWSVLNCIMKPQQLARHFIVRT